MPDDPTTQTEEEHIISILNPGDASEVGDLKQPRRVADPDALPDGWEEMTESDTRRKFYVNHNTKTTTWERPSNGTIILGMRTRANQRLESEVRTTVREI